MRIPFNWKTPIGYLIAFLIQACFFEAMLQAACCALGMLIGFFLFMKAFGESLQRKIYNINQNYKFDKNVEEITFEICDFIRLHSDAKELSKMFASIFPQ